MPGGGSWLDFQLKYDVQVIFLLKYDTWVIFSAILGLLRREDFSVNGQARKVHPIILYVPDMYARYNYMPPKANLMITR